MLLKLLATLTLVGAAAALAGLGTFATPIENAVPTGKVLHYGVSNVRTVPDQTLPLDIETVSFDVTPAIVSMSGRAAVTVDLTDGGTMTYQCSTHGNGSSVTCATTSPQLTADRFKGVTVVAQ